jgi:adenylate cyclase class IV
VKGLGTFLELETGVISNKVDAAKKFDEIKNLLSLDDTNEIRKSYRDLLMEKKGK